MAKDYVTCPVCGESGMPMEIEPDADATDGVGRGYITCSNLGCASNGGSNASKLLSTPETDDFLEGVRREAEHQRTRWGRDHDARKTDADWFWLVGYLAGKALHTKEKRLHHLVTTAAALLNWHREEIGK